MRYGDPLELAPTTLPRARKCRPRRAAGLQGRLFETLWTDFRPGIENDILDWHTIAVGATAMAALALQGALWVAHKTEGKLNTRSRRLAKAV